MSVSNTLVLLVLLLSAAVAGAEGIAFHQTALAPGVESHSTPTPDRRRLKLKSNSVLVVDLSQDHTLYAKNSDQEMPIASITKLMTAMVVLDAGLSPTEKIIITKEDKDRLKYSRSQLPIGSVLARGKLLHIALMASENRAAAALARTFPSGRQAFIEKMNHKAKELGMLHTTFTDPTGLHSGNTSTAQDLAKMLRAAFGYSPIRHMTTTPSLDITTTGKVRNRKFNNTNLLIRKRNRNWDIGLSKTGYILEAGRCLVMQANVANRSLFIVLLNAWGKYTSIGDSNRIRKWLESYAESGKKIG